MKRPDWLKKGDRVGIFVPASPVKEPFRTKGLSRIRDLGYTPVEAEDIFARRDFLAKEPEYTLSDFKKFWRDPEIKAIWAARGGYGSNHLLPLLSQLQPVKSKIIIGSSDVSYLLWFLLDQFKMIVFYGPMAYSAVAEDRFNLENFKQMVEGNYHRAKISGDVLKPGTCQGLITGGCLSNFVSLIGSRFLPIVKDRLLFLEDVNERPYRLDRMFWQISESGIFSQIKGLILGRFGGCFKDQQEKKIFIKSLGKYIKTISGPVIYDLPVGHGDNIHTIPLGAGVQIDTQRFSGLLFDDNSW